MTAYVSMALGLTIYSPANPHFISYRFLDSQGMGHGLLETQAACEMINRSAFLLWFFQQTNSTLSFWSSHMKRYRSHASDFRTNPQTYVLKKQEKSYR